VLKFLSLDSVSYSVSLCDISSSSSLSSLTLVKECWKCTGTNAVCLQSLQLGETYLPCNYRRLRPFLKLSWWLWVFYMHLFWGILRVFQYVLFLCVNSPRSSEAFNLCLAYYAYHSSYWDWVTVPCSPNVLPFACPHNGTIGHRSRCPFPGKGVISALIKNVSYSRPEFHSGLFPMSSPDDIFYICHFNRMTDF
jgi:hypothetical protein